MEELQQIQATGGQNQLPEEIIHHIQSLLSGKEAARTTMLSKSWHAAYLTRPNLDFSYRDILNPAAFVEFVKDTLQRYEELNIKIQSFRLRLDAYRSITVPSAKELILKAMTLGATDLSIGGGWMYTFPLPGEIFGSEALDRLSLDNCRIDLQDQKVNCSRLKYLRLRIVEITGITFWDIISICPLIEELILSQCHSGAKRILVSEPELGVCDFRNMKVLTLNGVGIRDELFFVDLSSRFPCLEDLSLDDYMGYAEIEICSNSLECISFTERRNPLRVVFDVPRLRKFVYSGCLPSLSFRTVPEELESDITIMLSSPMPKTQWFLELREFLLELNPSGICLRHDMITGNSCEKIDIEGLPEPPIAVENLKMLMEIPSSLHHALLDGIFKSCRPSFVDLYLFPLWERQRKLFNEFTEFVCKMLISESGEKQSMSALHDLEEVNVEFFEDDADKGCWPLPYKTLSDAVAHLGRFKIKVCLRLKWGGSV